MNRRDFLGKSEAFLAAATVPVGAIGGPTSQDGAANAQASAMKPLTPPKDGVIPVAFIISEGAVVIDFCGPWEVFQDTNKPGTREALFDLYTVAETTNPIRASAGLHIIPDYTFESAPAPKLAVIPAQRGQTPAMLDYIRRITKSTDLTMSICTGMQVLADTGLLTGKAATTHHNAYARLSEKYPNIQMKRGARFVEDGNLASSGGLSSGIDLALHVVERYFGREVATATAYRMEYQGEGWKDANSNSVYAK
ncbi:MAG TPA: DJ-1/PfpI family protein [Steroidobacteraceae bacterium]|jgi:transcriptional regulator GlxA family with amidase domain|nr:DJ-1/PfpI family protein [Steroidobacteraceae bacterium]